MKQAMVLAVLVLGGCDANWAALMKPQPMTVERHCRDVKELAERREMSQLEAESKASGEWGSRSGGMVMALQADKAGEVAHRECLMRQGRDPFK